MALLLPKRSKIIIPPNLRSSVLAWWDARERGQVWYPLNQLCVNGNFENDLTGWTKAGTVTASVETTIVKNGAKAIRAELIASDCEYHQDITIPNGNAAYIGVWVYIASRTDGLPSLVVSDKGSSANQTVIAATATTGAWQYLSTNKVAANGGVRVRLNWGGSASNTITVVFDVVRVFDLSTHMGLGNTPTSTEMNAILDAEFAIKTPNLLDYTYADYNEFTIAGTGTTKGADGIHLVADALNEYAYLGISAEVNQRYGLLYEVTDQNVDAGTFNLSTQSAFPLTVLPCAVGYNKAVLTAKSSITLNRLRFYINSGTDGTYVDLKNIRLFKLSTSQLMDDFDNLDATALNTKYPMKVVSGKTGATVDSIYWDGTRQVLCNPDNKYYWRDYSGNGRHMKLNNFAYSASDGWVSPYGLLTDGVDSWGNCGFVNQNNVSALTIGYAFVMPTLSGAEKYGVCCLESGGYAIATPFLDNKIHWRIHLNGNYREVIHPVVIPAGTRVFAIGTYDGRYAKLYVNGVLSDTYDAGANYAITAPSSGTPLAILCNPTPTTQESLTAIKTFCVFRLDKAVTEAEVRQIVKNNAPRFGIVA